MSQLADLLERDRIRFGFTVGRVAHRLGISPAEYRRLIAHELRHLGADLRGLRVAASFARRDEALETNDRGAP